MPPLVRRVQVLARGQQGLFIALASVTAGNVVFHVLAGRALGPADYGSLSALLTILLGLAIPAGAIQVALTSTVVRLRSANREVDHRQLTMSFAGFGLFGAALVIGVSPRLSQYLNLSGLGDIYLVGAFFVPTAMGIVYRSVLLGRQQYFDLGRILLLGTGLRVGAGLLVYVFRGGITAALVGTLVSEIVTTVLLARRCRQAQHQKSIAWRLTLSFSEVAAGIIAFLGLWILLGADTILARHHLDPVHAGAYAATALAARTVLFLPQAAVTAALPKFASERRQATAALVDTLLLCLVLGLAVTVGLLGLAQPVGHLVMGATFPLDSGVLAILSGAALWLALLTALVNFHLAQGAIRVATRVWLGFPLLVFLAAQASTSQRGLALGVLVSGAIATLATTLPLLKANRTQPTGQTPGSVSPPSLALSVVIPFRNEGPRTAHLVRELLLEIDGEIKYESDREFDLAGTDTVDLTKAEIIAVSDGSTDGGPELLRTIADPRVILLERPVSEGKGAALRAGMALARGSQIAMLDGDGDIAASHLLPMVAELDLYQADAVLGSKSHPDSVGSATMARRLLSLAGRFAAQILLGSPIPDSQTGIKVFRRALIVDVLPHTQENGYLFDLELLLAAKARGFSHLIESPVRITSSAPSSVGLRAIAQSAFTLLRLIGRFGSLGDARPHYLTWPQTGSADTATPATPVKTVDDQVRLDQPKLAEGAMR